MIQATRLRGGVGVFSPEAPGMTGRILWSCGHDRGHAKNHQYSVCCAGCHAEKMNATLRNSTKLQTNP